MSAFETIADDALFVGFDDDYVNPTLLELAKSAAEKRALIPPGSGPPPPDPAAGGQPMPGMAPPPDPSMGGMAPGGMPGQPADPSLMGQVPQQPMQPGAAPGAPGGKGGKAQTDATLASIRSELYQLRQLLVSVMKGLNLPIPDEAILGPQPPAPPQDPSQMAPSPAVAGAGAMGAPGAAAPPAAGGMPMPGAMPGPMPGGGGDPSKAAAGPEDVNRAADELLRMLGAVPAPVKQAASAEEALAEFWAALQPGKAAAGGGAPERLGTVLPSSELGPLRDQPLLLAMRAREAARAAGAR